MEIIRPVGDDTLVDSEKQFIKHIQDTGGVLVVNAEIPHRKRYNRSREFDGVLILPTGVFTVEVKGTRGATGELRTPGIDGWTIGGSTAAFHGRPGRQASQQAKILASLFQDERMVVGQVNGIVALAGRGVTLPGGVDTHFVEKIHVVVSRPGVGRLIESQVHGEQLRRRISIQSVERILRVLGGARSTPSRETLAAEGFLSEDEIAALVYAEQEEARAASSALDSMTPPVKPKPSQTTAERPAADRQRFEASRALDPDLTEVAEIIDGVAFSRAAYAKTHTERVGIVALAGIVNSPANIRDGDGGKVTYHFGEDHVVITRRLDGLVLDFCDTLLYERKRHGAEVQGWKVSANAVHRSHRLGLPLDALVRIAEHPEDEWATREGIGNVVRARCDYAAVCSVEDRTILSVTQRITAIDTAFREDDQPVVPEDVETLESAGVTIRGSALNRIKAKTLSVEEIVAVAQNPEDTWPGNQPDTEVRLGASFALIVDTRDGAVVATTTRASAIKYRNGAVIDGIRVIGRVLYAAAQKRILEHQLIDVVRNSNRRYRNPGRGEMVYVSDRFGVIRSDADGAITGLVPPEDVERHIATGWWVKVDVNHKVPDGVAPLPQRRRRPSPGSRNDGRNGSGGSSPRRRDDQRSESRPGSRQRPRTPSPKPRPPQLAPEIVDGIRLRSQVRKRFTARDITEAEVVKCLSAGQVAMFRDEKEPRAVYTLEDLQCVIRDGYLTSVTRPSWARSGTDTAARADAESAVFD